MSTAENTTGLSEVLAAHEDVSYDLTTPRQYTQYGGWNRSCQCGHPLPDGDAPDDVFYDAHRAHVADVLTQVIEAREAELRADIGRQIRATAADPERRRPLALDAEYPTDFANDFEWAARIAEGGN